MRERPVNIAVAPLPQAVFGVADNATVDELAIAASNGDRTAVRRLYDALSGPIHRYVALRVRRHEDAEDLTQLVFERLVASLPRYRHRGRPFQAWVFRIARNAVIDHVRRERTHEPLDGMQEPAGDGLEAASMDLERIQELRNAMATLTADQRKALALRFTAGLSADEAARVMGRRAGTVRGLTFRAIGSLRRQLVTEERNR
jgi:RNA polymerase sigma-70 factor (ECF subfamily)